MGSIDQNLPQPYLKVLFGLSSLDEWIRTTDVSKTNQSFPDLIPDLISGLPEFVKNPVELEAVKQRFMTLLDRYQEQPHLLDQYLPKMLAQLVEAVLKPASEGKSRKGPLEIKFGSYMVKPFRLQLLGCPILIKLGLFANPRSEVNSNIFSILA